MIKEIKVLDKGFVQLDASCADDLSVVNSARVSFGKHVDELSSGDEKLIGFLMRELHGTPFEHNFMRFRVKAPIFVFREWHRHRVGVSISEISGRYSELKKEYYIPDKNDIRTQVGKPGKYKFEKVSDENISNNFIETLEHSSNAQFELYEQAIANGISKEQARMYLPVNLYSEMYWSCNARSLMNFLKLRNSENAQWEIRQFAIALEDIWKDVMPITYKYFIENNRNAP